VVRNAKLMAHCHCRDLDEGIPKHLCTALAPQSSEAPWHACCACRGRQRGEDVNANVTVDYEKLGVNGTIHTYFSYVNERRR
jgi:hypothetical protein